MRPARAVPVRPQPALLRRSVRERLPVRVLAVPDRLRLAVLEQDRVVLPVTQVVARGRPEHGVALVEVVEVHVEGDHRAAALVVDDDGRAWVAGRLARGVGLRAIEPGRVLREVVVGAERDGAAAFAVELAEVGEGQRGRSAGDGDVVDFGCSVCEEAADGAREVSVPTVEPDEGCCDVVGEPRTSKETSGAGKP